MPHSESDTRAKLIDPAIHARGWTEDLIRREETSGAIEIIAGRPRKRAKGRIDYTLRIKANPAAQPIAVALIEAKAEHLPPNHGLEQAKLYATCRRLNVPFVFASNGLLYVEFDRYTGLTTSPRPLTEFPTPGDLRVRYEQRLDISLTAPAAQPLLAHYRGGEATRRYYQDAAIRAVLEKLAHCDKTGRPKRALLTLATGAGKTFIAVHLLRRIADAGQLRRALFVCDRDELRSQGLGALQNVFGTDAAEVYRDPDGLNHARNARVHVATYQTLGIDTEDGTASFLTTFYEPNYFSHVIIDECHRSAWGKWSEVLKRNPDAVQIGLTATPRQLSYALDTPEARADAEITADNLRYFGEPVYEYDIAQGIDDGYLAACEILRGRVNLDETGLTAEQIVPLAPVDATTGQRVTRDEVERYYTKHEYEDNLLLPDRVRAMCKDLFQYLLETGGPEQKTIIFCVRDRHADDVAGQMNNLYAAWCAQNGRPRAEPYAFKCTAASGGSQHLADLRGASRSFFIATTVELLTTGVDVPCVRNIVFFKYVRSPIAFYQMIGRGTRLHPPTGKLMFRIYDYTDATRLFGSDFVSQFRPTSAEPGPDPGPDRETPPTIQVEGFDVHVTEAGRFILADVDGKAMPVTLEEYKQRLAARLVEEAPDLDRFRSCWIQPSLRHALLANLPEAGRSALLIQQLEDMSNYDLYDVLGELGYGLNPRTRAERTAAFTYKHEARLSGLPASARATLQVLAAQFTQSGTECLESPHIFDLPQVISAGGLPALQALGRPVDVLNQTKARLFAA